MWGLPLFASTPSSLCSLARPLCTSPPGWQPKERAASVVKDVGGIHRVGMAERIEMAPFPPTLSILFLLPTSVRGVGS